MAEIHVNMKQLNKWKVYSDNVIAYDQIIQSKGKFFTNRPDIYTKWLDEFGIFYTLKGSEKEIRKTNPAKPRTYRGKYPRRIQSVGSAGKGETVFQLNDGSVYKVPTKMLIDLGYRNQSPGPGTDFDLMIGNDFDYVQHAIKTAYKTNPAKRRKSAAPSGRTGLTRKQYVSRPSQASGHRAPSKRLTTRRKKALAAPKGYFPNPLQEKMSINKGKSNFPYLVQRQNTENWNTSAAFKTKSEAFIFARELAAKYPRLPIRVMHYTGGPM